MVTIGRKPTEADFQAWVETVFSRATEIDPDGELDWNDMALGWLMARGVDHGFTNWEILSSYTCGDHPRMTRSLVEINAMVAPSRPEPEDE